MRTRGLLFWLGSVLLVGGAAILVLYSYGALHTYSAQTHAREWLSKALANPPAPELRQADPPVAVVGPAARYGAALGELSVPRLHLSVMVFEGADGSTLKIGAGHIPGTALPPAEGNIGIAAHRDSFFRPLRHIRRSDLITLKTPAGARRFVVTEIEIVTPTSVNVLARAPGRDLTLVTCYPFWYIGHAPQRFIVHAKKIA